MVARRHINDYNDKANVGRFLTHRGPFIQSGRGLGSFFSGIFRASRPLLSKSLRLAKKAVSSKAAKKFGSQLMDAGIDVATDALAGKNIGESVNEKVEKAKQEIAGELQNLKSNTKKPAKKKRTNKKGRKKYPFNPTNKKEIYDLMNESD